MRIEDIVTIIDIGAYITHMRLECLDFRLIDYKDWVHILYTLIRY